MAKWQNQILKNLYELAREEIARKHSRRSAASDAELRAWVTESQKQQWGIDEWAEALSHLSGESLHQSRTLIILSIANLLEPNRVHESWGLLDRVHDLSFFDPLLALWIVTWAIGHESQIQKEDKAARKAAKEGLDAIESSIKLRLSGVSIDKKRVVDSQRAIRSILAGDRHWLWGKPKAMTDASVATLSAIQFCILGLLNLDASLNNPREYRLKSEYSVFYQLSPAMRRAIESYGPRDKSMGEWELGEGLYLGVVSYPSETL